MRFGWLPLAVVVAACATLAPARTPPIAPDLPFRGEFLAATEWGEVELTFPSPFRPFGARFRSVDEAVALLKRYFALGVRPVDEDAVRVMLPEGYEEAEAFRLLVELSGGVNRAQAGSQFRIWVRRGDGGWIVDRVAESRTYCRTPLGGFSGRMCLDD